MVKIINIFGDVYSGQAGKAGVFAKWKGRQYRRKYVIPANPKTTMQIAVRNSFTNAVTKWHIYGSLQRLCYSYLATGLVMSGFNLLVSRWQKAATSGQDLPLDPMKGIKQVGKDPIDKNETNVVPTARAFSLGFKPNTIGSLVYTLGETDPAMDAYADVEMGDVRIPVELTHTDGAVGAGELLDEGDKLLISYTAGGRTITREVLYTIPASQSTIPAKATIALAIRTAYYPVDFGSVVIEIEDISPTEHTFTPLESLEIDNVLGTIFYDLTEATSASSQVDYETYTAIEDAKLEVTKVDTSFVTWRRYSDVNGHIKIAQTVEDETYDFILSAGLYISVIRAAQSSLLATKHELIEMTATS
ncbi:hypothetical protein ES705_24028 [subsurface metagenome]